MASFRIIILLLWTSGTLVATKNVHKKHNRRDCSSECPAGFKNVVFNSGYSPSQFFQIPGASNWVTFGLGSNSGQVPMMAFQSDVANAVTLVNSVKPPEYLLTFNEPDYSYKNFTPTMDPQTAADAIQPLLASPGTATKYIAPVTADPFSDWLPTFYAACNCQGFFYAYNIHVYYPILGQAQDDINNFHNKFADKPLWVTEIAPGGADPHCSLDWPAVESFMDGMFSWGSQTGWIEKIFWNTGNEILNDDNVCNSYLLDSNGNPSPLVATFSAADCS